MTIRGDLLKKGIIARLQEYDAYIDDELPDYILVMVANNKTNQQIKEDLQLFLTDNTDPFIEWLEMVLDNPSLLEPAGDHFSEGTPYPSSPSSTGSVSPQRHALKRQQRSPDHPSHKTARISSPSDKTRSNKRTNDQRDEEDDLPRRGVHRIKLPPDPLEKKARRSDNKDQPWNTKDQDLRSLIRRRKAETISDEEEGAGKLSVSVSSVVQLAPKKERPKRSGGTGRLLQKAISDIHGVSSSSKSSSRRSRKRSKSGEKRDKRVPRELESDVLELHQHEDEEIISDRDEPEVLPLNEPVMPVNKVTTSVQVKKKSIRERLDSTPERDDDLTEIVTLPVKKVLPPKLIDLRQILKNRKQKDATDSDGTRFIVTLDNNNKEEEAVKVTSSSRIDEELPNSKGLPERCRFWPNCKNGDSCPYHHPTVPCRLFPKCKYGQKCCFVHPVCKYDGRCTNPTCYYLHTVPKQTTPHNQSNVLPMTNPFSPVSPYTFGRGRGRTKFPTKSALSWTPGKLTVTERKFAVPDSQTSNMQV